MGQLGLGNFDAEEGPCVIEYFRNKGTREVKCGKDFAIVLGNNVKKKSNSDGNANNRFLI